MSEKQKVMSVTLMRSDLYDSSWYTGAISPNVTIIPIFFNVLQNLNSLIE